MLTFIPGVLAVVLAWRFKGFMAAVFVLLAWIVLEVVLGVLLFDLPR